MFCHSWGVVRRATGVRIVCVQEVDFLKSVSVYVTGSDSDSISAWVPQCVVRRPCVINSDVYQLFEGGVIFQHQIRSVVPERKCQTFGLVNTNDFDLSPYPSSTSRASIWSDERTHPATTTSKSPPPSTSVTAMP